MSARRRHRVGYSAGRPAQRWSGRPARIAPRLRRTALHLAAACGHSTIVRKLVSSGASITAATQKRATALHLAVAQQRQDTAELLLDLADAAHGVDGVAFVNARDLTGATALHVAAQSAGSEDMVSLLLRRNADRSLKDASKRTAWDVHNSRGVNGAVQPEGAWLRIADMLKVPAPRSANGGEDISPLDATTVDVGSLEGGAPKIVLPAADPSHPASAVSQPSSANNSWAPTPSASCSASPSPAFQMPSPPLGSPASTPGPGPGPAGAGVPWINTAVKERSGPLTAPDVVERGASAESARLSSGTAEEGDVDAEAKWRRRANLRPNAMFAVCCALLLTLLALSAFAHLHAVSGTGGLGTSVVDEIGRGYSLSTSHNCSMPAVGDVWLSNWPQGVLYLFDGARWGTVCEMGFNRYDVVSFSFPAAEIVCKQLSVPEGIRRLVRRGVGGGHGAGDTTEERRVPINSKRFYCTGVEASLLHCRQERYLWGEGNGPGDDMRDYPACSSHADDVVLQCTVDDDKVPDENVRACGSRKITPPSGGAMGNVDHASYWGVSPGD